jgi:hypothetical protein
VERVVYILGAGFSAPLGLSVMSNFLEKSRDAYSADQLKYRHFARVFENVRAMSYAKNYYACDLFNIEEILSILELNYFLSGKTLSLHFRQYVADVVNHFTPPASSITHATVNPYTCFLASLLNVQSRHYRSEEGKFMYQYDARSSVETTYDIVSMNYDLVLERTHESLALGANAGALPALLMTWDKNENGCHLAKLHGTAENARIVAPTWRKGSPLVSRAWSLAREVLKRANHLRFLGYSLPESDAYFRYLLKSAVLDCQNLKTIDVLCLDPTRDVQKRYEAFVTFPKRRFKSCDIKEYLEYLQEPYRSNHANCSFNYSERRHNSFMLT